MHIKNFIAVLFVAALLATGCGGGGSSSPGLISSAQQSAANNVGETAKLSSLIGRCVGGFVGGGVNGVIQVVGSPGITPTTTVTVNGTTTTTTVDYGAGITSGSETISGSFTVVFDTSTNTGTITFTNFTDTTAQGTTSISGTIQYVVTPTGTPGVSTVQTQSDLTVNNNGQTYHLTGTETADVSSTTGLIDISTATITLTSTQGTLHATGTNLTFDSTTHRVNGGTVHATYQPAGIGLSFSVNVAFDSQTPTSGVVHASFDGSPSVAVHVPVADL